MKAIFKTMMLTAVAVAAFGADRHLKFQVEFPFTIGDKVLPAGQYKISQRHTGVQGLYIENIAERTAAFVALSGRDSVKLNEPARIEFACSGGECKIDSVSNLSHGTKFTSWKKKAAGTKLVAVVMTPAGE